MIYSVILQKIIKASKQRITHKGRVKDTIHSEPLLRGPKLVYGTLFEVSIALWKHSLWRIRKVLSHTMKAHHSQLMFQHSWPTTTVRWASHYASITTHTS